MGLFNSTVLEVIIGVIFVYLLLSILCTSANEWVAALTRRRGEMLRKGIRQLLSDQKVSADGDQDAFLKEFYKHPLIASLKHDKNHPAYIAPRTFVAVITDLLTAAKPGSVDFADFENGAKDLPEGNVKKSLLALVQRSNRNFYCFATLLVALKMRSFLAGPYHCKMYFLLILSSRNSGFS